MATVQDIPRTETVEEATSPDARKAALEHAVAELTAQGWKREAKRDYERVLVGHNGFRVVMVRRQWGFRDRRVLVDVDGHGVVSTRPV